MLEFLFGKKQKPIPQPALPISVQMRDTLYGDMGLNKWPPDSTLSGEPWSQFVAARTKIDEDNTDEAIAIWQKIAASPNLEPRHYLQAWHFLRMHKVKPSSEVAKEVYGIVIEVSRQEGLDVLAVYRDHTARFYSYSDKAIVLETMEHPLHAEMDELLVATRAMVSAIGPWEGTRLGPPPLGHARISGLVPSGIHFGQAPMELFENEPLGRPVLGAATAVMVGMIEMTVGPLNKQGPR